MKKWTIYIFMGIVLCVFIGCSSKNASSNDNNPNDKSKTVDIDDTNSAFKEFFTKVFNDREYEKEEFIKKYCTEKLQEKLQKAYEFADEDGYDPWYATEMFRSYAQDGPTDEYKIVKIVPENNGWYKYDFIDMGNSGSHRIKVITHITPRDQIEFYIDDIE